LDGALYDEFLSEEGDADVSVLSQSARSLFSWCCIFASGYEKALELFEQMLTAGQLSYDLLNGVQIITEKASGRVREEAVRLYEKYSVLLEEIIDLDDIINTGIAFDDFNKKEIRALAVLTPHNFKKELFGSKPVDDALFDKYMKVSIIYTDKKMYGMAEKYLRQLLVSGYKTQEVYARLSEVYEKLGNIALAEELAKNGK
jgi:tetratricopeptide (TPR) repeat protein